MRLKRGGGAGFLEKLRCERLQSRTQEQARMIVADRNKRAKVHFWRVKHCRFCDGYHVIRDK